MTADDLRSPRSFSTFINYLVENQHIQPIRDYKTEFLTSSSLAMSFAGCRRATHLGRRRPGERGAVDLPAAPAGLRPRELRGQGEVVRPG